MLKNLSYLALALICHPLSAEPNAQPKANAQQEPIIQLPATITETESLIKTLSNKLSSLSFDEMDKHKPAERYENARKEYSAISKQLQELRGNHPSLQKFNDRMEAANAEVKRLEAEGVTDKFILEIPRKEANRAQQEKLAAADKLPEVIAATKKANIAIKNTTKARLSYAIETDQGKHWNAQITALENHLAKLIDKRAELQARFDKAEKAREDFLNQDEKGRAIQKELEDAKIKLEEFGTPTPLNK